MALGQVEPTMTSYDVELAVVGAGPAGRALAHRGALAGLSVALIDPDPHRQWRATYAAFTDELPDWLDASAVAASADEFTVYTPQRRRIARGYTVLSAPRLQESLRLDGVVVIEQAATALQSDSVTLADGGRVVARAVVDSRGAAAPVDPGAPRQTAFGVFVADADRPDPDRSDGAAADAAGEMVVMDWRPASGTHPTSGPPSFSYRIAVGDGRRLLEETCVAGAPAVPVDVLAGLGEIRCGQTVPDAVVERVDFPLYTATRPWRERSGRPTGFGAAGGLMNPVTGYSVAAALRWADRLVAAVLGRRDLRATLWPARARWVYRLRLLGLAVLLELGPRDTVILFDAFFRLDVAGQRAFLSRRDDLTGMLRAMALVFARLPWRLRWRLLRRSVDLRGSNHLIA